MAMTQEQTGALSQDPAFRNRVMACCVKYADAINTQNSSEVGHVTKETWARSVFNAPVQVAMQIQPFVCNDGAVQDAGVDDNGKALVGDPELQSAVEATVNKTF